MWTCEQTRDALMRGDPPGTDESRAHTESCDLCSQLLASHASLGRNLAEAATDSAESSARPRAEPAQEPSAAVEASAAARALDDLFAGVLSDVARDGGPRGWLRQRPTRQRIAISLALPALLVVVWAVASRRADFLVYPRARMGAELVLYAVLAVTAVVHALRPTQVRTSPVVRWVTVAASLALPLALASLAPAHVAHPASLAGGGADFWIRAVACFRFGFALSLPVLIVMAWGDRLDVRSLSVAALMGTAAALVANNVLHVHCPITGAGHLFLGHATIGFALLPVTIVLAWLRRRRG